MEQHAEFVATEAIVNAFVAQAVAKSPIAKPRWDAADVAILRQHYPAGGLSACRDLLPHKTDCAIHWKARALDLRAPGYMRKPDQWTTTPFIDEAIRRFYLGTPRKGELSKLALRLHRPPNWVSQRARQLGIVPPRFKEVPWSARELALLREHAHKIPITISKLLFRHGFTRTSGAVSNKLMRLRCDRTDDDHYNANAVAGLMGVNAKVVTGWVAKGWLKARGRGTTREHDILQIHRVALRRFIVENVGSIDIRRVEKHWFVDLIAGA